MAKILIAESYDAIRALLTEELPIWGHEVVGVVANLADALSEVKLAEKKGVQVAIVGDVPTSTSKTKGGAIVAAALAERLPGVRIIAFNDRFERYGDILLPKPSLLEDIKSAIEKALAMGPKAT